jgi:hypothetical protein
MIHHYAYLSLDPDLERDDHLYHFMPEVAYWIDQQLKDRLAQLSPHYGSAELQIYTTNRTWRRRPLFLRGYPRAEQHVLLEAWCFGMEPRSKTATGDTALHFVLDGAPLKELTTKIAVSRPFDLED